MKPIAVLDSLVGDIYPCHVNGCSYVGKKKLNLSSHLHDKHFGKKRYCEHCDYSTRVRTNSIRHEMCHTGVKPFECPVCKQLFLENSKLKRHVGKKHPKFYGEDLLLSCELCSYKPPDIASLKQHMFTHKVVQSDHYCAPCDQYFYALSHLQAHCKSKKHQLKALTGELEATDADEAGLGLHKKLVSMEKPSGARKKKGDKFNQKDHSNVTNKAMKQLVESKYILRRHSKQQRRIRKGKPPKDTMFKCKWCEYSTGNVWDYIRHLRKIKLSD